MALLDVSELLVDPDLIDTVALILRRFVQTVGADGVAVNVPTDTPITGSVQVADGANMLRRADAEYVANSINVFTLARPSTGATPDQPADVIVWQGNPYTVVSDGQWTNYGAGYVMVRCELVSVKGGV